VIRSLVARLTILEQITAIIVIVAFGVSSLAITAHVLRIERRAFVAETARHLAEAFDDELAEESDTLAAARGTIDDGLEEGVRVEIRGPAGRLIASSRASGAGGGDDRRRSSPEPPEMFLASATSAAGIRITAAVSDAPLRRSLSALARSIAIAAIPILALQFLLGRSMVKRALNPLSAMADRAATLSVERNPRSLGPRSGLDEVDRLAASFDHLLGRLDDALQAERRLTANASHELRTPLTVLGGELEMLLEQSPQGSATALGLKRAAAQVGAMRELVEAILLLHRSGDVGQTARKDFEIINLCDLARETLAEIRIGYPEREHDLDLSTPDEVLVEGETALLASSIRNLVDNALKFSQPGRSVRVEIREAGSWASLTVDDQGPGIPEDQRERVFDPFYRGAEARAGAEGFGLGLPIVRHVAKAHGGDVEVLGSPLGGARVVLRLPRFAAATA
jgi:signal transduction histidine kinase